MKTRNWKLSFYTFGIWALFLWIYLFIIILNNSIKKFLLDRRKKTSSVWIHRRRKSRIFFLFLPSNDFCWRFKTFVKWQKPVSISYNNIQKVAILTQRNETIVFFVMWKIEIIIIICNINHLATIHTEANIVVTTRNREGTA